MKSIPNCRSQPQQMTMQQPTFYKTRHYKFMSTTARMKCVRRGEMILTELIVLRWLQPVVHVYSLYNFGEYTAKFCNYMCVHTMKLLCIIFCNILKYSIWSQKPKLCQISECTCFSVPAQTSTTTTMKSPFPGSKYDWNQFIYVCWRCEQEAGNAAVGMQ